ncbi:hypothetical protein CcaverHIS002_0301220 [Cutaneotrichosporon cavernicola]|uniref:ClpP/crotonase n=1 Tax=Cutaneotrichosporon cavernicola TaxID=279322 RepID=A0AA48IIU9_9TREE|nr:uncharacterized protein CcaverHIS019_0301180 [Cutaneotrichosporon cavernicola]BEI82254.1 hypothetical protein CcaverHIS002_0301220 [Cutaneotrichosporon cavernicola]BEI90048.1 hypothetical protein CcaverHIS019_0301180 [Cutaneotrichosporon cavernicola]BEI97822.1 hypothetical protein CcaverHIS631_0301210 [Cutaneotrichosporon cavernicola]BEJ05599.1 hypothetical protein CcaverHIS641_0301210 [Cutaneotrichosporon cavernicola]
MAGPPVVMDSPASVTISRPEENVWVLSMERKPDNRLSMEMLALLAIRLDEIEAEWRQKNEGKEDADKVGGAVVFDSHVQKFWSNGFIPVFLTRPGFKDQYVTPLLIRILNYPLVTVAAISGHCFAGGMLLALTCDFRIMGTKSGWMSMNELLIGLPLQTGSGAVLRAKLTPNVLRDTMMGKRWTAHEAHAAGFVDETVSNEEDPAAVTGRAIEVAQEHLPKVAMGAWGQIKKGLYSWVGDTMLTNPPGLYPKEEGVAFFDRLERRKANL